MIPEFERMIAHGGSLEDCKNQLIRQCESTRQRRLEQIRRDFNEAELIRIGLEQPKGSPGYAVAKGLQNWYRRKYPTDDSGRRELRKFVWTMDQEKGAANDDEDGSAEGETGDPAGEQYPTDGGSDCSPESIFSELPPIEP